HLQHLPEPALRDVEQEERAGDDGKHDELQAEFPHVASRQRIVEGLVPAVEAYLTVRSDDDDGRRRRGETDDDVAGRRGPQGPEHHAELRDEARLPAIGRLAGLRYGVSRLI